MLNVAPLEFAAVDGVVVVMLVATPVASVVAVVVSEDGLLKTAEVDEVKMPPDGDVDHIELPDEELPVG